MGFLGERLLTNCASVVLLTCVDLEVHPEVAGITKGLTAVFTLVRLHSNMSHEMHIEFSGCNKSSRTHAALKFLLSHMTLTFSVYSGCNVTRVSITAVPAAVVAVLIVRLSCSMGVARPRGRR